MRSYDSATQAAIAAGDIKARHLVWIKARNRDTGAEEAIGFWNGDQNETVTVDGVARPFIAAGALLGIDPIEFRAGSDVMMHRLTLSPINEAVQIAIRGYEPRFAPITVWRCLYNLATDRITGAPHRIIDGWIDEVAIRRAAVGGESSCEVTVASSARAGTRYGGGAKSQQHIGRLYQYSDISGAVEVKWG